MAQQTVKVHNRATIAIQPDKRVFIQDRFGPLCPYPSIWSTNIICLLECVIKMKMLVLFGHKRNLKPYQNSLQ